MKVGDMIGIGIAGALVLSMIRPVHAIISSSSQDTLPVDVEECFYDDCVEGDCVI